MRINRVGVNRYFVRTVELPDGAILEETYRGYPAKDSLQEADSLVDILGAVVTHTTVDTGEHPTLEALGRVGSHFVRPAPTYLDIRPQN